MSCIYRGDRLVTTAGVALRDGRYFLARRQAGGAQSMRWEFPGGKCDEGDADERRCLVREFHEEFGVPITVGSEIGTILFEHKDVRFILVGYAIELHEEPTRLSVHSETGWFQPGELLALDLADSDRIFVERYIDGT